MPDSELTGAAEAFERDHGLTVNGERAPRQRMLIMKHWDTYNPGEVIGATPLMVRNAKNAHAGVLVDEQNNPLPGERRYRLTEEGSIVPEPEPHPPIEPSKPVGGDEPEAPMRPEDVQSRQAEGERRDHAPRNKRRLFGKG